MATEYYKKPIDTTENTLYDLVECLKLGDIVVLTIGQKIISVYHKCDFQDMDVKEYLSKRRVIFMNVKDNPDLANSDDGWDYYFTSNNVSKLCTCEVKNVIKDHNSLVYKYYYELSFGLPIAIMNKDEKINNIISNCSQ